MTEPERLGAGARVDAAVELGVLEGNLSAGTCVGDPATEAQQDVRRDRIDEIHDFLEAGETS